MVMDVLSNSPHEFSTASVTVCLPKLLNTIPVGLDAVDVAGAALEKDHDETVPVLPTLLKFIGKPSQIVVTKDVATALGV